MQAAAANRIRGFGRRFFCADDVASVLCCLIAYPDMLNMEESDLDSTALHQAAFDGRLEVARVLIQCKADLDKKCYGLYNCRRRSCYNCFYEPKLCLRKLILFLFFRYQQTPLYVTATRGQLEVARLLVQCKADLDAGEYR